MSTSGTTGYDKSPFPFKTHGQIVAPVLIVKLGDNPSQQLVVASFDGFLYVIDGESGCADALDLGEVTYRFVAL